MNNAPRLPYLLNEDRPDFQHVLDQALRVVLDERDGSDLPLNSEQLRTLALASADQITRAVTVEYDAYHTLRAQLRDAARESDRARDNQAFGYAALGIADGAGSGAGVVATLAVLTPLLAGAAAVIFLFFGYTLHALSLGPGVAQPLRTAGWFFAAVTGASLVLGAVALVVAALRNSGAAIHDTPGTLPPEVTAAREVWQAALLAEGLLPFLTDTLDRHAPPPGPERAGSSPGAAPAPTSASGTAAATRGPHLPRLGYSRPDFTPPQGPGSDT